SPALGVCGSCPLAGCPGGRPAIAAADTRPPTITLTSVFGQEATALPILIFLRPGNLARSRSRANCPRVRQLAFHRVTAVSVPKHAPNGRRELGRGVTPCPRSVRSFTLSAVLCLWWTR